MGTYIVERDTHGRISKMKTEEGEVTIWTDIYYNEIGNVTYKRDTYVNQNHEVIDVFEQWRDYWYNGEIKEIRSNKGSKQTFNEKGIPMK